MRNLLLATSALMFFGASAVLAQGTVNPGTGQFGTQNLGDEPTPDFVEPNDQSIIGAAGRPGGRAPNTDGVVVAQANCIIVVEPGTGEFKASDTNDSPLPGFVDTKCPDDMMRGNRVITGTIDDNDVVNPGTGQFEPADIGDEPTPDFVEPEITY